MEAKTGKNRSEKAVTVTDYQNSNYAMPEDMSAALQKLIVDRLMKVNREARRPEADAAMEGGVEVGWQDRLPAAREIDDRSAQNIADEDLGVVVTED